MVMFPVFKSAFLNRLCRQLEARSKAIKHHGDLTWETKQPDEFEWLTVYVKPVVGHPSIFQFVEDNRACVFVRSRDRRNRGKILFQVRDVKLIDNAQMIVEAVEATITNSTGLRSEERATASNLIRAAWSNVEARVFNPHA